MRDEIERARKLSLPEPGRAALLHPIRARSRGELHCLGQSGRGAHAPPRPFPLARRARARGRLQVRQHQLRRRGPRLRGLALRSGALSRGKLYPVLRRYFWLETDSAYKSAVEAISRKRAALRNITQTDQLNDFAATPSRFTSCARSQARRSTKTPGPTACARSRAIFANTPTIKTSARGIRCRAPAATTW